MSTRDMNPNRTISEFEDELYRQSGIERVLRDNSAKPFVKRILFPFNAPVTTDTEDPKQKQVMTHKMEYKTADGKAYAYPRVMLNESGELQDYGDAAFDEALKRRDFIKFETPEMADNFTKLYKKYWDQIGYVPQIGKQQRPQPQGVSAVSDYLMTHSGTGK